MLSLLISFTLTFLLTVLLLRAVKIICCHVKGGCASYRDTFTVQHTDDRKHCSTFARGSSHGHSFSISPSLLSEEFCLQYSLLPYRAILVVSTWIVQHLIWRLALFQTKIKETSVSHVGHLSHRRNNPISAVIFQLYVAVQRAPV